MALQVDEYFATGEVPGPRSRASHRPLRVLRQLPTRRRQVGLGRRDRAAVLGEPLHGARARAMDRPPDRRRGAGPDPRRPARRVPHPRPRRLGRRACRPPTRASPRCCRSPRSSTTRSSPRAARSSKRSTPTTARSARSARRSRARPPRRLGPTRCATRPSPTPTSSRGAAGVSADERCDQSVGRDAGVCRHDAVSPATGASTERRATSSTAPRRCQADHQADRRAPVRRGSRLPGGARLLLELRLVGRERQPTVLGRRRGGRAHRRPDRAADDAVGVVPPPPLGARPRRAEGAAPGPLRHEGRRSISPKRS